MRETTPILIAALVLTAPIVRAQTLDQSIAPPRAAVEQWFNVNTAYDWAQTFTAGLSGQLTRVEVQAVRESSATRLPLVLDVRRTTPSGAPVDANNDVLASVAVAPTRLPTNVEYWEARASGNDPWAAVDLTGANLHVRRGDVLAVVLRSDEPNVPWERGYRWKSYPTGLGDYPGGDAYGRNYGYPPFRPFTGSYAIDSSLRTYVLVPEPGAAVLVVACAAILVRRRGQ